MTTLKAITLTQPYASLMAIGAKCVETRSWPPHSLRPGDRIAIHAGKGFAEGDAKDFVERCRAEPFRAALVAGFFAGYFQKRPPQPFYPGDLPRGAVVALARFVKAIPGDAPEIARLSELETAFGYYGRGRWGWLFEDVQAIEPIPARGKLGIWTWEVPEGGVTYLDVKQEEAPDAD